MERGVGTGNSGTTFVFHRGKTVGDIACDRFCGRDVYLKGTLFRVNTDRGRITYVNRGYCH